VAIGGEALSDIAAKYGFDVTYTIYEKQQNVKGTSITETYQQKEGGSIKLGFGH
jgi:hypothetical protein